MTFGFNYLRSPKGLYFGQLRDDGNFVVYRGSSPDDRHDELWSTDSAKLPAGSGGLALMPMWQVGRATTEVHQQIVADRPENGHQVYHDLWESNSFTLQNSERGRALVEDDGNFCVYKLTDDVTNPKPWQSNVTDPVSIMR